MQGPHQHTGEDILACQVEVGDGALGPQGGHHVRMQTAQVMVSSIGGTSGSSQIELIGQWGSSSHTVHLREQQRWPQSGSGTWQDHFSLLCSPRKSRRPLWIPCPSLEPSYLRALFPCPEKGGNGPKRSVPTTTQLPLRPSLPVAGTASRQRTERLQQRSS